nr:MAG TPA: hypothetical protein [Caudoviricetes sp.]
MGRTPAVLLGFLRISLTPSQQKLKTSPFKTPVSVVK